jgi:4-amino-4-deoxy-L-arabinose transferase-like glycosyltransferase
MTNDTHHVPRLGFALILQATVALVGAVVITFSPDHSPFVGLLAFAVAAFLLAGGQLMTAVSVTAWPRARTALGSQAVSSIAVAGIAAASLGGDRTTLTLCVSIWAAVVALTSGLAGWSIADRAVSRDFFVLAGLAGLLAIVEAALPLSDVYAVGFLGAYFAVFGVFSIIAGVSMSSSARRSTLTEEKK